MAIGQTPRGGEQPAGRDGYGARTSGAAPRRGIPTESRVFRALAAIAVTFVAAAGISCREVARVAPGIVAWPDVDAVFAEYDRPGSPGCALGVIEEGEFVYRRGYGAANLEHGTPIDSTTVFRIGSTSKQFTAMAVHLLQDDGLLTLDDDLRTWFPEIPDYGETVTIRHLLHHTSGIRDYLTLQSIAGLRDDDFYTDADVVALLSRQQELNFDPGAEFLYSNSGYFLLGQIVLRETGMTLAEFGQERIFEPLAMTSTHFHDDHTVIVPQRASGYAPDPDLGFRISMTTLEMIGDGGIFTSVDDLLLWDRNFYDNRLAASGPALIDSMLVPGVLDDGTVLEYASGLDVSSYRGVPLVSHGGAFVGFRADMLRFPGQATSIAVLCNLASADPSSLARRVADVVLSGHLAPPDKPATDDRAQEAAAAPDDTTDEEFLLPVARLRQYVGDYYGRELDVTYHVRLEEGRLRITGGAAIDELMRPLRVDEFGVGPVEVTFYRDVRGDLSGFLMQAGRVEHLRFDLQSNE